MNEDQPKPAQPDGEAIASMGAAMIEVVGNHLNTFAGRPVGVTLILYIDGKSTITSNLDKAEMPDYLAEMRHIMLRENAQGKKED
jgi:hypothetical protein